VQDYYLKFDSETQADSVLWNMQNENRISKFRNTDVIGIIYEATGNMIMQGEREMPEMVAIPGWHVNVRAIDGEDGTPLDVYKVYPTHPRRVWA
jgi:hypothetical protein